MALEFIPLIFKNKDQPSQLPPQIPREHTVSCGVSQRGWLSIHRIAVSWRGVISKESWVIQVANSCPLTQRYLILSWARKSEVKNCLPKWARGAFGFLGGLWEVDRSDHHGGSTERIAGPFEVVPLDSVEFSDVLSLSVVYPVQVGRAAGVVPPSWQKH